MKRLLVIWMLAASAFAWAAGSVTGEVLEVQQVDSYTYLRMRTANGETWGAVATAPGQEGRDRHGRGHHGDERFPEQGAQADVQDGGVRQRSRPARAGAAGKARAVSPHTGVPKAAEALDVKVAKAVGANARTVGEIMAKPGDLKDKPVLVRGKVVKYSGGIMGRNWIHLRDGSGAAADKTNDLLVTTTEQAKVGDVVTAKGVVRVDKDFGAGYVYKALVEDAALQR